MARKGGVRDLANMLPTAANNLRHTLYLGHFYPDVKVLLSDRYAASGVAESAWVEEPEPETQAGPGTFAALRHRNFRIFYIGHLLSLSGTWLQITALGWLVLELTDSPFWLGVVNAGTSLPILLFSL